MRWVKETFPPRERARWLLTTIRLSASSLAGTARTLVAVGTVSEAFMFLTTLAAAPRSGVRVTPFPSLLAGGGDAFAGGAAGAAGCCRAAGGGGRGRGGAVGGAGHYGGLGALGHRRGRRGGLRSGGRGLGGVGLGR